jgi:hypothetical protein
VLDTAKSLITYSEKIEDAGLIFDIVAEEDEAHYFFAT